MYSKCTDLKEDQKTTTANIVMSSNVDWNDLFTRHLNLKPNTTVYEPVSSNFLPRDTANKIMQLFSALKICS